MPGNKNEWERQQTGYGMKYKCRYKVSSTMPKHKT